MENKIQVSKLKLYYTEHLALNKVSIDVAKNSVLALIGPSGCGKSTFLKTLNRMNDLIEGVRIEGEVNKPGNYFVAPGTSLETVLGLAGGLTSNAFLFGTRVERASVRQQQREGFLVLSAVVRLRCEKIRRLFFLFVGQCDV